MLALNTSLDASKAHLNHSKGEVIRFLVLVCLWRKRLAFLSSEFSCQLMVASCCCLYLLFLKIYFRQIYMTQKSALLHKQLHKTRLCPQLFGGGDPACLFFNPSGQYRALGTGEGHFCSFGSECHPHDCPFSLLWRHLVLLGLSDGKSWG